MIWKTKLSTSYKLNTKRNPESFRDHSVLNRQFLTGAVMASTSFHCPSILTTRFALLFFPSIMTTIQGSVCDTSFLTNSPFLLYT